MEDKLIQNEFWAASGNIGRGYCDAVAVADWIVQTCGVGATLDVGSGEGHLVGELLKRAIQARGIDISDIVVARSNEKWPRRFDCGTALDLPFADNTFKTVVATAVLEHLDRSAAIKALGEIFRVTARFAFLQINTVLAGDHHASTIEGRTWWEERCFEAGFRKHPTYYHVNAYEALNEDKPPVYILLEKLPAEALICTPLESLQEERLLHMDMLRTAGRRSDAHCVRYHAACQYIRPNDTVLDVSCGLGYGSYILFWFPGGIRG